MTLAVLALVTPAAALPVETPLATVDADVQGADHPCPLDAPAECPFTWDDGGTLAPGDDEVRSVVYVDTVRVRITSPSDAVPPQRVDGDPKNVTIQHPVNRELNQTWMELNDSRPDALKSTMAFESRPKRVQNEDGTYDEDEWGLFLTVFFPVPVLGYDNMQPVAYCWDTCSLDNQTYLRGSEDELRPFPNGIYARDYTGDEVSTDYYVDSYLTGIGVCFNLVECDLSPLHPALQAIDEAYQAHAPEVAFGAQANRTDARVEPATEQENDGSAPPGGFSPANAPRRELLP